MVYDAGKRTVKTDKKTGVKTTTSSVANTYFFFYNPAAKGLKPEETPDSSQEVTLDYPELCEIEKEDDTIVYWACDPRIWVLDRPAVGLESLAMRPLADATDIRVDDPDHIYLHADENLGTGKITDPTLRSYMRFDDLKQGLWSLVGIIGPKIDPDPDVDPTPVDFGDPATWAAWDVVTFMLGSPWENGEVCE